MSLFVNIKKSYPDFILDIAFESRSKRIGILGASGCGKSLTLKSIAGIVRPDDGRISYDKRVWFDKDKRINVKTAKRNVGYLFQDYALFPNMTVEENIAAALHAQDSNRDVKGGRSADRRKPDSGSSEDILKQFGIWDVKDHRPDELSGGQQQRGALARMMACDPELILLDEPFSAMDTFLREGMRLELIRLLDMYNKTVIIVSHDRDEIYQMCDHLILMDKGRIIAQGDTDDVFEHPETVAAARLTGCKNISRIERINDHRIKALDWNDIELITDGKVTGDITHAGIRAHDLMPGEHGVNVIRCGQVEISRLPFEWYITLENGLWWKQSRELSEAYNIKTVPEFVSVMPDRILLMHD